MNTKDLKTFEILPFGAKTNNIGTFQNNETPMRTTKTTDLLDANLLKTVQVVDTDTGYPLENVNVFVKGTNRGGITKADGNITLVAQSPDEVIVFTWQNAKREIVFKNLGSMVNIDTTMTQNPVNVTAGPALDSKVNWMKWGGLVIGAIILLSMLSEDKPKKITV